MSFILYIQKDKFLSFNLIYNTYASGTSDKLFGYISIVPLRNFNKLTNIVRNVYIWRFSLNTCLLIACQIKNVLKTATL